MIAIRIGRALVIKSPLPGLFDRYSYPVGRTHIMRKSTFQALSLLFVSCALATAQDVGPSQGALVIVGGAMKDPAIMERFIELAGGPEAPIVIIPTAGAGVC